MRLIHPNSQKSYQEHKESGKQNIWRKRVYDFISDNAGSCDRDVFNGLNAVYYSDVQPEITRLRQDGLVVEIGKKKCSYTGKKVRVLEVSALPYYNKRAKSNDKQESFL